MLSIYRIYFEYLLTPPRIFKEKYFKKIFKKNILEGGLTRKFPLNTEKFIFTLPEFYNVYTRRVCTYAPYVHCTPLSTN